jgi:hypothetical protein
MFQPLDFSKLRTPPATVATVATRGTDHVQHGQNVATVATVASPNADPACDCVGATVDRTAIEERAGLAADSVPAVYLDAWSRLNHQRRLGVSEAEWRLALDDGGRFLDAWGSEAAELGWTPGELFDVRAGLVWRLVGQHVEAIGADHLRLSGGRTIVWSENLKWLRQAHLKTVRSLRHG